MLRLLATALVLANLLFFAWARGWFAPGWPPPRHGESEPERLAAQVNPEAVTVLPPKAASAALSAARASASVCLQAGPIGAPDLAAAEAALAPAQVPEGALSREPLPPPPLWLVTLRAGADPAVRRAREAELKKLGLAYETPTTGAEPANVFVLSRHPSQAAAEAAVAALATASQPLKGARVATLPPPVPQVWLRVARADADLQGRLQALPPAPLAGGFKPCVDRP
jgi:hypothetical protein